MAKNNNLGDFLTDIADAIRTKKGTSGTINAQNFSTEIINLPSGGNTLKTLLDATKRCDYLFGDYTGNNVADLMSYSDTENVTNMEGMFYSCYNITSIPLLDTSSVKNMEGMFQSCANLTIIPALNISNVTFMNYMFDGCSNLTQMRAYGMKVSFNLESSTLLPASELEIIFGNLADLTGQTQRTITIGATNKAKLTAEQIAIATAKNWVVA